MPQNSQSPNKTIIKVEETRDTPQGALRGSHAKVVADKLTDDQWSILSQHTQSRYERRCEAMNSIPCPNLIIKNTKRTRCR